MKGFQVFGFVAVLIASVVGCNEGSVHPSDGHDTAYNTPQVGSEHSEAYSNEGAEERQEASDATETEAEPLCHNNFISAEAVEEMLLLTAVTDSEDIYSTYDRIDAISTLFEDCEDTWGLFPLTYRHITARGIKGIENGEFEDLPDLIDSDEDDDVTRPPLTPASRLT